MMMTSGQAVKYSGSIDCAVKVIKGEGFMSLMKGAGKWILNILFHQKEADPSIGF